MKIGILGSSFNPPHEGHLKISKEAIDILKNRNVFPTLIDARFVKPLDTNLLNQILDNHEYIVTIEEGSIGGFSSAILNYVHNLKVTSTKSVIKNIQLS